jgi:hypothetical protein
MDAAIDFYRKAFDWAISPINGSSGDYHSAITAESDADGIPLIKGSINGGLFKRGTHGIESTFIEMEVSSIDESVRKVLDNGGKLVREKRPMMDFGFFAIILDPDGNHIGLMEYRR